MENLFVEKRTYPRFPLEMAVQYRLVDDPVKPAGSLERKKEQKTQTLNVSLGGLFIKLDGRAMNIGSILSIDLFVPDSPKPVTALAEVVRADGEGWGFRFLAMKSGDAEVLGNYLNQYSGGN